MQAASPGSSPALPKLLLYLLAVMLGGALLAVPLFHLGKAGHAWLSTSSLRETSLATWLLKEIERATSPATSTAPCSSAPSCSSGPFCAGCVGSLAAASVETLRHRPQAVGARLRARQRPAARAWLRLLQTGRVSAPSSAALVQIRRAHHRRAWRWHRRGVLLSRPAARPAAAHHVHTLRVDRRHFRLRSRSLPQAPRRLADRRCRRHLEQRLSCAQTNRLGFGDVQFLLAEFATLFAVGWVLAQVRMQTGALWAGIGLHGGWVFGLKYFSALTDLQQRLAAMDRCEPENRPRPAAHRALHRLDRFQAAAEQRPR
jgi:hypothetical protein